MVVAGTRMRRIKRAVALETCGSALSFSILNDGKRSDFFKLDDGFRHERMFWKEFPKYLTRSSLELREIDAVATTRGPGRFTGVRMGIAIARAWAEVAHVNIFSTSTQELMAWAHGRGAGHQEGALACIVAFSGAITCSVYGRLTDTGPASVRMPETAYATLEECLAAVRRHAGPGPARLLCYAQSDLAARVDETASRLGFGGVAHVIPRACDLLMMMSAAGKGWGYWHDAGHPPEPLYLKRTWDHK